MTCYMLGIYLGGRFLSPGKISTERYIVEVIAFYTLNKDAPKERI